MQIMPNTPRPHSFPRAGRQENSAVLADPQPPNDGVILSNSDLGRNLSLGVQGAIPLWGVAMNVGAGVSASIRSKPGLAKMNAGGAIANLSGTISLAAGLLTGNNTATMAGLALLGVSGLTAGITASAL